MANQFNAKIRFDPVAWRAFDDETGASVLVIDNGHGKVDWSVSYPNGGKEGSRTTTPSAARAACRRAIARFARSSRP